MQQTVAAVLVARAHAIPLDASGNLSKGARTLVAESARQYEIQQTAAKLAGHAHWSSTLVTLYLAGIDVAEPYPRTSAVQVALRSGNDPVVHALLELGIDVNRENVDPLLHIAVDRRQAEMVEKLLARRADPEARDGSGRNAWDLLQGDDSPEARSILGLLGPAPAPRQLHQARGVLREEGERGAEYVFVSSG